MGKGRCDSWEILQGALQMIVMIKLVQHFFGGGGGAGGTKGIQQVAIQMNPHLIINKYNILFFF